jgi:hypothetical protein
LELKVLELKGLVSKESMHVELKEKELRELI